MRARGGINRRAGGPSRAAIDRFAISLCGPVSEEMEIAQMSLQLCDAHTYEGDSVVSIYHDYRSCLGVMRLTKNL
jgi:hypothetical protein